VLDKGIEERGCRKKGKENKYEYMLPEFCYKLLTGKHGCNKQYDEYERGYAKRYIRVKPKTKNKSA
jgi:hypothetical protein